jgi:hypothetical protein
VVWAVVNGNETFGCITGSEFLHWVRDYQLLKLVLHGVR